MNAHLQSEFKKGFFLTEENLIKLSDIIHRRVADVGINARTHFKVYRIDGVVYEVEGYAPVIGEENSRRNAIKRLEILCNLKPFELKITFDEKEPVELLVEADNKDFAYLLYSDIKEYLMSEVLKFRSFKFDSLLSSGATLPFFALMLPLFVVTYFRSNVSVEESARIIATDNVQEKLNFLINHTIERETGGTRYLLPIVIGIALVIFFGAVLLDRMFPRNIFHWGKIGNQYDRFIGMREKAIWGVIVAFLIGVASTVFVEYFKPTSPKPVVEKAEPKAR